MIDDGVLGGLVEDSALHSMALGGPGSEIVPLLKVDIESLSQNGGMWAVACLSDIYLPLEVAILRVEPGKDVRHAGCSLAAMVFALKIRWLSGRQRTCLRLLANVCPMVGQIMHLF